MKLLCIDHGTKRIGVAVCDALGISARELAVIQRTTRAEDYRRLNALAAQHQVQALVIGLPFNDQAAEGEHTQADTVKLWAARWAETTPLPMVFYDEQLTSHDARSLSIRLKRGPREPIDDLAARVILQSYLDAVHDGLASFPILP
jgi:putative holliday junction resolvase